MPKKAHVLKGNPSQISAPRVARKFTPGSRCEACGEAIFTSHDPRPSGGRRWRHGDCRGLPMPKDHELVAAARRSLPEDRRDEPGAVREGYLRLWNHWHRLVEPRRPALRLPPGVSESDAVASWGFEGVLTGLSSGRRDLWARIVEAVEEDPTGEAAAQVREASSLLDYADSRRFVEERLSGLIDLPLHDGSFPGTDREAEWSGLQPPSALD